ncbi:unnamed protein product [Auanema sp. JU1783]|nr:unnamed protein product [Auanema sp. JU1783]
MVFWISDDVMKDHYCPWDSYHIEVPQRLDTIDQRMEDCDFSERVTKLPIRLCEEEEIQLVHTTRYIDDIKQTSKFSEKEFEPFSAKYEDIYVNQNTYNIARIAAAAAIDLTAKVYATGEPGFASIRPPGHHASPDAACGFCIFNNVAIAAKSVIKAGAKRVLIVDWDVHAGQGTQDCIENEENIRLVSIHRFENGKFWPNLEQSDVQTEFEKTVNVPLNTTGMTDSDYIGILSLVVVPMIQDYKPEMIIVSCGFDAAFGDPEGEMAVTPGGFGTMAQILLNMGIPTAFILEGGYFLDAVAASAEFVLRAMLKDDAPHIDFKPLNSELVPVIRRIHKHFSKQYPSFSALSKLQEIVKPDSHEDIQEFKGVRNMIIPFPTRGLYNARDESFETSLLVELDDIVNAYKKANYQTIILENNDSIELRVEDDQILLLLPYRLFSLAYSSVVLPINPTTPPSSSKIPEFDGPSKEDLIHFQSFLKDQKCNEVLKNLPIYSIYNI